MPYIKQIDRDRFSAVIGAVFDEPSRTPGELNFLLTEVCRNYLTAQGLNYLTINDIIGALSCCQQEFYRRVAVDYENEKLKINGDVYP